jgi:hypothetical protein
MLQTQVILPTIELHLEFGLFRPKHQQSGWPTKTNLLANKSTWSLFDQPIAQHT